MNWFFLYVNLFLLKYFSLILLLNSANPLRSVHSWQADDCLEWPLDLEINLPTTQLFAHDKMPCILLFLCNFFKINFWFSSFGKQLENMRFYLSLGNENFSNSPCSLSSMSAMLREPAIISHGSSTRKSLTKLRMCKSPQMCGSGRVGFTTLAPATPVNAAPLVGDGATAKSVEKIMSNSLQFDDECLTAILLLFF